MLANNNLKVCRMLVKRDFQFHRVKNLVLAFAAMLITALYSFVFLLGSSVENAYLLSYQYAYGSASHILYTGLTSHQADVIAENANVKSTVRLSTIGKLSDSMIGQRFVKLAVTDRAYAETVLSVPAVGRLPERPGEIALDEFTMNSLGVLHELGAAVSLRWMDSEGREHMSDFTLCGWWTSPMNFTEACAWIAADTAEALAPGYRDENSHNVTLGVNLYQPKDLEVQAEAVLLEQGITGCEFTTNLAYQMVRKEMAGERAMPFYAPAALVFLCGYLMVYSIVHVAAERDYQFFAGLKSLGMTPRQIFCLLVEKGVFVTLLSMVPGWILGFLLHGFITGRVIIGLDENPVFYFLSWKPFAASVVCTLITVLLSYLLPAFRMSGMTPTQTIRSVSGRTSGRKRISDGRITLMRMAFRTLGRSRGRTFLSVISLLLAALLLSSVGVRYISIKEELYMAAMSPWDYNISDGSAYLSAQIYNEKNHGIGEEDVHELKSRPEVVSVSVLKSRELQLNASEELRRRIADFYNQSYDETRTLRDTQKGFPDWCNGLDRLEQRGEYTGLVIGLDGAYLDYVLEYSPFTSGSFDEEAFASGDYVLAGGACHEGVSAPAAGETITLCGRNFTVLGSIMHDDSYLNGSNSMEAAFHIAYILPVKVFDQLFPKQGYRQLAVNIDNSRQTDFENYLDEYEQGLNRGVGIARRSEYQMNFETARLNMVLPELVIGLVLWIIALMNFANMLVVKMVSRKSEFAVYESLGMTRFQLNVLVLLEGVFHAMLMALIIVPSVILFNCFVMPEVIRSMESWSMVYTFSMMPLGVLVIVVVMLAVVVPVSCLHFIVRGSLNERMRPVE